MGRVACACTASSQNYLHPLMWPSHPLTLVPMLCSAYPAKSQHSHPCVGEASFPLSSQLPCCSCSFGGLHAAGLHRPCLREGHVLSCGQQARHSDPAAPREERLQRATAVLFLSLHPACAGAGHLRGPFPSQAPEHLPWPQQLQGLD